MFIFVVVVVEKYYMCIYNFYRLPTHEILFENLLKQVLLI